MKKLYITLTVDVYDEVGFIEKHKSLDVIGERISDAVRWLDGVLIEQQSQAVLVDEQTEVVGDRAASESRT